MKISASYLSIKENLEENIKKLSNTNVDYIHVDIMDGKFVSNTNITDIKLLELNKPLDIHLMVKDVYKFIDMYKNLKPEYITFHLEIEENLFEIIDYIKSNGIKAGLSIKPNTDIGLLTPYLHLLDLILVMSVEPGKGGQEFIIDSKEKIDALKIVKKVNNYNYQIEVDGGINNNTIKYCENADIVVVGSYITNSEDYQKIVNTLKTND